MHHEYNYFLGLWETHVRTTSIYVSQVFLPSVYWQQVKLTNAFFPLACLHNSYALSSY